MIIESNYISLLVAHCVKDLLLLVILLLVDTRARALTLDPVVAGGGQVTVLHRPDFRADRLGELAVLQVRTRTKSAIGRPREEREGKDRGTHVGDDEDTALVLLERRDERSERLAVEVVGRLVENDDVRATPGRGGKDDLDLLTTGETAHRVVRSELRLKTKIGEMLLNLLTDQRTQETSLLRLARVDLLDLRVGRRLSGRREGGVGGQQVGVEV